MATIADPWIEKALEKFVFTLFSEAFDVKRRDHEGMVLLSVPCYDSQGNRGRQWFPEEKIHEDPSYLGFKRGLYHKHGDDPLNKLSEITGRSKRDLHEDERAYLFFSLYNEGVIIGANVRYRLDEKKE